MTATREATDAAIDSFWASSAAWREVALAALEQVASEHDELTSDDVWEELDRHNVPRPGEPRWLGGLQRAAVAEGLIRTTDRYVPSRRERTAAGEVHHSTMIRVWASAYRPERTRAWPPPAGSLPDRAAQGQARGQTALSDAVEIPADAARQLVEARREGWACSVCGEPAVGPVQTSFDPNYALGRCPRCKRTTPHARSRP